MSLKGRLEQLDTRWSYTRKQISATMPAADASECVELILQPWQLSFDPAQSLKGKSKMVDVLRCCGDFLERPFNSVDNPIHVVHNLQPGADIPDFSIGHGVGFAKSLAWNLLMKK